MVFFREFGGGGKNFNKVIDKAVAFYRIELSDFTQIFHPDLAGSAESQPRRPDLLRRRLGEYLLLSSVAECDLFFSRSQKPGFRMSYCARCCCAPLS